MTAAIAVQSSSVLCASAGGGFTPIHGTGTGSGTGGVM